MSKLKTFVLIVLDNLLFSGEKNYTSCKNFTLPLAVTGGTNLTSASRSPKCGFWFTYVLMSCVHKCDPLIFFARRWLTSVGNFATTSREGLNVESGFMN